jgi:hypothetical protein
VRRLVAFAALVLALAAVVTSSRVVVAQGAGERVVMTPGEGTLHTRFLFIGAGFTPGRTVSVRAIPPDGLERRVRTEPGIELVWRIPADGTFALELTPAVDFPDAPPGHWRMLFCQEASPTCQQLEFDVFP